MFEALAVPSRAAVRDDRPFVMLPELRFATAALQRLVHPGRTADRHGSLTTLIGPRGSGKTRLIAHTLSDLARQQPRTRFVIQSAGDWLALLASPDRQGGESTTYPSILVAEDADRTLANPEQADPFARWLDELLLHNVRVLVTVSEPPGQTAAFTPRLVSRLHAGLCVRLPALSVESRKRLARGLVEPRQIGLADAVLDWIAAQSPGTCRSVTKLVDRLTQSVRPGTALASLPAGSPSEADEAGNSRPALAVIAAEVAAEFDVPIGELRSDARDQALQLPRRCAMWLAHEVRWPMAQIGQFFGRRTHASVSYSCRELQRQLAETPTLSERLQRLQLRLVDRQREECG
jgi:chromosomal replication initiation ATPase DnaA